MTASQTGNPSTSHRDAHSHGDAHSGPGVICACLQSRMTARALTRMYDEALRPVGLKVTQLSLLAAIDRGLTGSISALADMLALERTTLTRNLRLLGEAGLIAPRASGGRAVAHELTEAGREALARATPLWRKAQDAVETELGSRAWLEARDALRALRRVARAQSTSPESADFTTDHTAHEARTRGNGRGSARSK